MAAISLAIEPTAACWDSAFALADRVERIDPARAELFPLRTRVNMLAGPAGAALEADLWPHLIGLTACVLGDPERPGLPTGALLVMHVDADAAAGRLSTEVVPRLGALLAGKPALAPGDRAAAPAPGAPPPAGANPAAEDPRRVANINARGLFVWRRGRDVLVAWGDDVLPAARSAAAHPVRSIAPLCADWAHAGKPAPKRVGAFWPARCWSPPRDRTGVTPVWRVLADTPPAVWWGWNNAGKSTDSIQCSGLRDAVRRVLERIPLDPAPIP
jgi:hypothetical protein